MLIRTPKKSDPAPSEITPESVYLNRRSFIGAAAGMAMAGAAASGRLLGATEGPGSGSIGARPGAAAARGGSASGLQEPQEKPAPYEAITTHNNFYEFGTDKRDPSRYADEYEPPEPWTIEVEGHCENTGTYDLWDLLRRDEVEDRTYRLRCVEAWSMVIPWQGVPLRSVVSRLEPTSRARYLAFETIYAPDEMRGQRSSVLDWPYVEGLRLDEALNELPLLVTGLYSRELPNQNGAPVRLIVPWKYGFKSIKSVVKLSFVEEMPPTTWNRMAPHEYGFFANVNPNVDHPRWSQATERRLGDGLFPKRIDTRMFNGYEEEVAHLYRGMDLREWY